MFLHVWQQRGVQRKSSGNSNQRRARRRGGWRPRLEPLEDRTLLSSTVYWTGMSSPPDPSWSNAANWSGQVPQDGDTVVFTKSRSGIAWTSKVDASFTASSITLIIDNSTFGDLNLTHSLTLTGASALSGEPGNPFNINLDGNDLTNDGTLTVDPDAAALRLVISSNDHFEGGHDVNLGGALVNQGTILQQGGDYGLEDHVQIHNQAGAAYDFTSDGGITEGLGGQLVKNAGTMEKTGGTGTSVIGVSFSNLGGTLAADSGTLQLVTNDTRGASTGGTFDAAQGAVLDLVGGGSTLSTNVFSGSYTGSGQGTVLIGSGSFLIGAGGVTFNFPSGLLHWGANASSFINLQGNTLTNTGFVTLSNNPGNVDGLQGESAANDTSVGGTLINRGTIVQQGGDLLLANSVQIHNQAGATYDFASDGGIVEGFAGAVLSNTGTMEKTGGTGTSVIGVAFSNLGGTLAADSGTLQLATSDTLGASTGGTFNAEQGAVLELTGGGNPVSTNIFSGSYTGSGQGTVLIGNDAFVVGTGGATFDFPAPLLQWSGTANGSVINLQGNTLTNTGFLTLSNTSTDYLIGEAVSGGVGGTLINRGTIIQQGDLQLADNVQIDNQVGATYDFASDDSITAAGSMSNAGTVEKTGGTGASTIGTAFGPINFSNSGVVQVQSGKLQLFAGLPLNGAAALTGTAAGTLSVQGNVVGNTTNSAQFAPLDRVVLAGPGTTSPPQLLEVMSQDLGNSAAGFGTHNFVYGTLDVAGSVRLVDHSHNSPGTNSEALYVDTLIVESGAILDLNGLNAYARHTQIDGQVTGGTINPPPATRLAVGVPVQAVAGGKFGVSVDAVDAGGRIDTSFNGAAALQLMGGPAGGKLSGTLTAAFVKGVATFNNLSLNKAGTYSFLAASSSDLIAATTSLSVVAAPQFKVTLAPASAGSGQTFTATITAILGSKPDAAYLGTVVLTGSDPQVEPITGSFQSGSNGTITLGIVLDSAGKQTVTVADTTLPSDRATSNAVTVGGLPLDLDHFVVTGMPATDVVNMPHTVTIIAVNKAGQRVTNFTGVVTLTSSDGSISIPVNFPANNNGVEKVSVTFTSIGTETLTASGGGKTGTGPNILVVSPATHLGITTSTIQVTAGGFLTLTVKGLTAANMVDTLFADLLRVTTSDPHALIVPGPIANGVETFTITFTTALMRTIMVNDLGRPTLKGPMQSVSVSAAPASQLVVTSAPLFAVAGSPIAVTVTAEDSFGNRVVTGFTDKVTLSSGQSYTFLPSDHGKHVFSISFSTAGTQALTASDSTHGGVTASSPVDIDVVSSAVGVSTDPTGSGGQALIVIVPAGGGTIQLMPTDATGTSIQVTETVNGKKSTFGPFALMTADHIIVYGQTGNDVIEELPGTNAAKITVPAILLGGSGTNTLSAVGSSANNVLVGGAGKDVLTGGTGRDILIGGGGADKLHAGTGGDVLIGGSTTLDDDLMALAALLAEWSSSDSYQTRVQDLFGTGSGGQNGNTFLDEATVVNDAAINQQFGGSSSGQDWFFLEGTDRVSGVQAGEIVSLT
jgi:hypothetical protein